MGFFQSIFNSITQSVTGQGSGNLGTDLGNLGKQMAEKAVNGVGEQLDQGVKNATINLQNAYGRINPINQKNYPLFQSNSEKYLEQEGILWFVRKDLEAARYYCSWGKEGYGEPNRLTGSAVAANTPPFLKLKNDIEETEKKVVEMETIFGDGSDASQSSGLMGKLMGAGKRLITGESLFMTLFTNNGSGKQRAAFAAPYPGKIIPMNLRSRPAPVRYGSSPYPLTVWQRPYLRQLRHRRKVRPLVSSNGSAAVSDR